MYWQVSAFDLWLSTRWKSAFRLFALFFKRYNVANLSKSAPTSNEVFDDETHNISGARPGRHHYVSK
jgi:hypothetical protein